MGALIEPLLAPVITFGQDCVVWMEAGPISALAAVVLTGDDPGHECFSQLLESRAESCQGAWE